MMGQRGPRRCLATLAGLAMLIAPGAAGAQDALFLRIRPRPDPTGIGVGGGADAERAAREAAFERSNARARRIIESVCTGCLAPWTPPQAQLLASAAVPEIPAVRGLEIDRPGEASEPTFEPSIPERRP